MGNRKVTTTVRLDEDTHGRLKQAAYVLRKKQTVILEEALQDYFEAHNIGEKYQLTLTPSNAVLLQLNADEPKVLEVAVRNGVSPSTLAAEYRARLKAPVKLVLQEGDEHAREPDHHKAL